MLRVKELARWIGAALVAAVVATACSGEAVRFQASPSAGATAASNAATTSQPTIDPSGACTSCWPLNGKPLNGAVPSQRPLLVKIDNVPLARPHYGITQADMVIEELVEGYVTRLAAIYQSQDPQTIGGVRSARLADRSLTAMVNGALVYSGTSDFAWSQISQDAANGKYVELSADHSGGYYRVAFRQAPYNMFTSAIAQRDNLTKLQKATVTDVPKWSFIAASDHAATSAGMSGSIAASEIAIPYREDTSAVSYKYDAATKTYGRWQNSAGKPVRDIDAANNAPVAASTVAIVQTEIWEVAEIVDASGSHAHDMRLVGTGSAIVFRDGLRQVATWTRADDRSPFVFTNAAGERILLSPGQTWVHIVPPDWVITSS